MARLGRLLLALALVLTFAAAPSGAVRATGATGPIQLGGDDQNDHGGVATEDLDSDPNTDETPVLPPTTEGGWRYVMVSLKEMLATEQRAGASNSVAVIGTNGSAEYIAAALPGVTANDAGVSCTTTETNDSYCMMEVVKAELDRLNGAAAAPTITYYETALEVAAFFDALTAGTINVAAVYITGDGGPNDLSDGAADDEVNDDSSVTTPMEQALADSASDIATFNAQGGAVLASGTDHYASWLSVLVPSISVSESPTGDYIGITTDGAALWDGLTDLDVSSIWHNHFTGDLGALKVLGLGYEGVNYDSDNDGVDDSYGWRDLDSDDMIDDGEASRLMWDGPDSQSGTADDAQTIVVIGGAAGEAAIGEELPETNREGDTFTYWLAIGALLTAGTGLMLRGRKTA